MPESTNANALTPVPCHACILSIDVEEYFQIEAAREAVGPMRWGEWPGRIEASIDWLLATLERHHATATFFTLGWVAQHHPAMIRRIVSAGHELACHGFAHQRLGELDPISLAADVRRARATLEDIAQQPVTGYRAPTFSLDRETAWAVDILAASGFEYDSSIQPIRRPAYGVADAPVEPFRLTSPRGADLLELPPLTLALAGGRLPVAGGGYFRLFPLAAMRAGIAQARRCNRPSMLYFHPWEFDPDQPRMPLTGWAKFRTYVGLKTARSKLGRLLADQRCISARQWIASHRRDDLPSFSLSDPAANSSPNPATPQAA